MSGRSLVGVCETRGKAPACTADYLPSLAREESVGVARET